MIVVDASALIEVLLQMPSAEKVESILFESGQTLHAPHLIDIEITQVIRRYTLRRQIASNRAREALDDFMNLRLRRYAHGVLLDRVWDLRDNLSAYDASYVALAEALDAPLLTRDSKLAGAAGHHAYITLIAD